MAILRACAILLLITAMLDGAQGMGAPVLPPLPTADGIRDQPIPGADGGWMTVHVEAGLAPKSFHVTCEKGDSIQGGLGHYLQFNGRIWSRLIPITADKPFRSGVHMAVDPKNGVHFCWGANGKIHYRALIGSLLGPVEVVTDAYWIQGDVAVTPDGGIFVAATPSEQLAVVFERQGPGQWKRHELPHTAKIWAPTITAATNGDLFVVARENEGGSHATACWKRSGGTWNDKAIVLPGHNFEANVQALDDGDFIATCYRSDRHPWLLRSDGTRQRIAATQGWARGQHVGLARTVDGIWWTSYSTQGGVDEALIQNRTVDQRWRSFFATSSDRGATWTQHPITQDESGQGWGNLAVNGEWVMMIWPDARQCRLRCNLIRSTSPPSSNQSSQVKP